MATSTADRTHDFDATTKRAREFGERLTAESRTAGISVLDAYEKAGRGLADFQQRLAGTSQVEWLTTALGAQADLTRTVVSAQTSAARELLK